ncbi:FtsX-like permease family protein [Pyxidicoccus xibeiensis]|uniref:FtsX-like permease family protein n=1 Tax=Pyxidicoccus xibeiensis TaxID=2906759 RepID=UPI0020A7344D|nr:FtsX-like permease family protein [Pyxidicoccus xibeiensis]MCP3138675.1 FtsX-like permease family protein [Pyxidicoccus xibeiensis]
MTLVSFALQSVLARPRSWVVALLAAGSAVLLTVGSAFVEGISDGTQRSLIESGTGHLQLYNSTSPGEPVVVTDSSGVPELKPLPDFPAVEARLKALEGVREVVPLEVGWTWVARGNYLDEKLASARAVAREPASASRDARLALLAEDLQRTLRDVVRDDARRAEAFAYLKEEEAREDRSALEEVGTPAFWERFRAEPLDTLEYLENRVARQVGEGQAIDVEYLASDLEQFPRAFPRFELVTGSLPPAGQRGLLLGHGLYEQGFKLPIAALLDQVQRERERGATFAMDESLTTLAERCRVELPDLLARLDGERSRALTQVLEKLLGHPGGLEPQLREFLTLDDANFDTRYAQFQRELAPHLPLYRVKPGDSLVLMGATSALGASGVPVKVWGTFRFKGLGGDTSRVNTLGLVDLVTARYLAGRRTQAEVEQARRDIEALGMGGPVTDLSSALRPATILEEQAPDSAGGPPPEPPPFERHEAWPERFTAEELRGGSVLQAALVLAPEADPEAVAARIDGLAKEAGLPLATVDWEAAGGLLAGIVGMTRVVLLAFSALLALFVVLVSASTLLVLARERIGEVGTLRAVGMQRREAFGVLLLEGLVLGTLGAGLGAGLGVVLLRVLAGDGVSIQDESLQFFMGGAVLEPQLSATAVVAVVVGVLAVVVAASLVPAWRGSSVEPIVAMRKRED